MKRAELPARYTIERAGDASLTRFLAIDRDGDLVWAGPKYRFNVFDSEAKAAGFRQHRMGSAAKHAVVVRHTIQ